MGSKVNEPQPLSPAGRACALGVSQLKSNKTAFQGPECPEEVDKVHEVCHIEILAATLPSSGINDYSRFCRFPAHNHSENAMKQMTDGATKTGAGIGKHSHTTMTMLTNRKKWIPIL